MPNNHSKETIEKLIELTDNFDSSVRDSALRSLVRLKSIAPKNMMVEVNNILRLHHSRDSKSWE